MTGPLDFVRHRRTGVVVSGVRGETFERNSREVVSQVTQPSHYVVRGDKIFYGFQHQYSDMSNR